ncbi:MAG: hypothetical protein R2746_13325 [Acidimicrobiales bacterium]
MGTFPLPESQLDRFTLVLTVGLPDRHAEREILTGEGGTEVFDRLRPVTTPGRWPTPSTPSATSTAPRRW